MEKERSSYKGKYLGYALPPEQLRELIEDLFVYGKDNQKAFLIRMLVLLVVSTIIATAGLLSNSAAVVIGAMLVAPLMRPVMSCAAAITLNWPKRFFQSLLVISWMAFGAIVISCTISMMAPDMVILPKEILARTKPTFFDLLIALAAGAGGAYTMTRKESSAIPGVAMAVALLPPLASSGILLTYFEYTLALKAFVLFATNFAAMIFIGAVTFRIVGVKPKTHKSKSLSFGRGFLTIFAVLVGFISVPLYFYSQEIWYDAMYKAHKSEELQNWLKDNNAIILDIDIDAERQILYLSIQSPNPPLNLNTLYDQIDRVRKQKQGRYDPFKIKLTWTQGAKMTWPIEEEDKTEVAVLAVDHTKALRSQVWTWSGTQYAQGDWLKPNENDIATITVIKDRAIKISTTCGDITGTFELNQEIIKFDFSSSTLKACDDKEVYKRFVLDFNNVSSLSIEADHLSFQMSNNSGVLYFIGQPR